MLPGVGHFTILDSTTTSPADAGNNFFLNGHSSIGKPRAEEAVPLLRELNDSVDGIADTRDLPTLLESEDGREWIKSFSLVIAHNLESSTLDKLAGLLWEDSSNPPLMVVRSAGLLADFYVQIHEHCGMYPPCFWTIGSIVDTFCPVIESHSETTPSLRLTQPFTALQQWAGSIDYDTIDPTDHAHIPFAIILIKEADQWRNEVSLAGHPCYNVMLICYISHSMAEPCQKRTLSRKLLKLKF